MIYLCLAHMSEEGVEQKYVKEAFDTNWVVPLGPNVNSFEADLKEFAGGTHEVVALSAGTAAVHLALLACGVGPGDEVLVQSFTFCASSHPITYLGATPVFVDSEADTWNMDPELLEEAIKDRIAVTGKKPKAIVPVALYGMPYDCEKIMEVADRYGVNIDNLKNAAEELERLSKKEIEAIATAVKTAIEAMVNEAYFKKQAAVVSEVFAKTIGVVSENFEKMSKASERIETHQRELSKNIENIGEASEKIEDVLDSITRLADQTKILSFNAQIEAVRAGAAGKSFVVVAGEIKDLADTSKATAEDIATLTTAIKSDVESTVTSSEKTIESADEQSDYIDDASENVEELQTLAKQFSKFVAKNTKQ